MNLFTANAMSYVAEKSNWEWATNIFLFIGIAVCVIITLIAIVWLTCFFVKLLVKTFSVRVGKSYDLMVEDITKKAEAKKERNEIKRNAKAAQKKELLNMKLENKERIHEMKKYKLSEKLDNKEKMIKGRLFGENAETVEKELKAEPKKEKKVEEASVKEKVSKSKTEEPKPEEKTKDDSEKVEIKTEK